MVHQNKAPTAYPAVGAFILVARSEDSNRATAPQCRNQQSSGLLVSPRESPRGMGKGAERAGVEMLPLRSLTENVGLFFYC